jgi:hypothetical protein
VYGPSMPVAFTKERQDAATAGFGSSPISRSLTSADHPADVASGRLI